MALLSTWNGRRIAGWPFELWRLSAGRPSSFDPRCNLTDHKRSPFDTWDSCCSTEMEHRRTTCECLVNFVTVHFVRGTPPIGQRTDLYPSIHQGNFGISICKPDQLICIDLQSNSLQLLDNEYYDASKWFAIPVVGTVGSTMIGNPGATLLTIPDAPPSAN